MLKKFFVEFANGKGIVLIPEDLQVNKIDYIDRIVSLDEVMSLQDKNNCLEIYLNLSNKYRDNFTEGRKAKILKMEVTKIINMILKAGTKIDNRDNRNYGMDHNNGRQN